MKNLEIIIVLLVYVLFSVSCDTKAENKEAKPEQTKVLVEDQTTENLQKISLEIEGMTCEIGCARTIQSKLSKKKGVKSVKVSFEDKKGIVSFDGSKITKSQIIEVVNEIAGGDVYKVVKTTKIE